MQKKFLMLVALATTLAMTGCAEYSNWTPTVDTYQDPNAQNLTRDMQECRNASNWPSRLAAAA